MLTNAYQCLTSCESFPDLESRVDRFGFRVTWSTSAVGQMHPQVTDKTHSFGFFGPDFLRFLGPDVPGPDLRFGYSFTP